jgi:hypothetical protein
MYYITTRIYVLCLKPGSSFFSSNFVDDRWLMRRPHQKMHPEALPVDPTFFSEEATLNYVSKSAFEIEVGRA